jgi:hypothetical protein
MCIAVKTVAESVCARYRTVSNASGLVQEPYCAIDTMEQHHRHMIKVVWHVWNTQQQQR